MTRFLKLFSKKKDYKTLTFHKFAQSIGVFEGHIETNIEIKELLSKSFEFLNQEKVLTHKQEQEYHIFKDRYNLYLEYCIENRLVKKNHFEKVKSLSIIKVPDMSKIKVPDISKELEEMDIDLEKFAKIFSKST